MPKWLIKRYDIFVVSHLYQKIGPHYTYELVLMLHSVGLINSIVFTRNKLIVFTTSGELSHYVVFSWIMAERKVGVVLKSIVFFCFLCVYSFIFTNRVFTYFVFEKWDKYTFWSNTSICTDCKTHFVTIVEVHNSPRVHDWWLRDLEFTRKVWDGSTCRVYGKHQFSSPIECSIRP